MKKIISILAILLCSIFLFARSGTIDHFGDYSIRCPACIQKTTEMKSEGVNYDGVWNFCNGCQAVRYFNGGYKLEHDNPHHFAYRCTHNHVILVDKDGNWKTVD